MRNHDLPDVGAYGHAPLRETEFGPLPEEWEVVRLGEVAKFSRNSLRREGLSGQVPFLPMSLIPEDSLYITRWELREPSQVRSGIRIENGDLLLSKITPCLENGKQGIVTGLPNEIGLATTEVIPIRPFKSLITEFLALYLKVPSVRKSLADKMEGTTGRQRLPKSVVISLPIPLPPLPEQRAIAQVLRTVQRTKEATERVIAAARQLKKSLMRHLFTYGPVPLDQVDGVRLKETEIGPLPEGWEVVRLGEVALIKTGPFGSSLKKSELVKSGFKVYEQENILREDFSLGDDYITPEKYEILRTFAIEKGDILVSRVGSFGKAVVVPNSIASGIVGSRVLRIRCFPSLLPDFVRYSFSTIQVQRQVAQNARGVTLQGLNTAILSMLLFPLPPLPEQQAIAEMLRAVDRKMQAEERRKAALEALFRTLLHQLMTGKVRMRGATTEPEE